MGDHEVVFDAPLTGPHLLGRILPFVAIPAGWKHSTDGEAFELDIVDDDYASAPLVAGRMLIMHAANPLANLYDIISTCTDVMSHSDAACTLLRIAYFHMFSHEFQDCLLHVIARKVGSQVDGPVYLALDTAFWDWMPVGADQATEPVFARLLELMLGAECGNEAT